MSSGPVNPFVDFGGNANDSNENNAASIQPVVDGEGANAAVFTRPTENMRKRSEVIRGRITDSLFLENADRVLLISGPGKVTWPGSTTAAASGIPVLSDVLWILPMLTPGFAQAQPLPPVASTFGVLHLKRATGPSNAILVTSQRRSYAAGDQINITVTPGSVYSCTLDTEDTGALRRTIKIVATGATTLGTVIASLNGLTPPAPDNTALVSAALEGGAISGDLILTSQARQFVSGNYDGEGHAITPTNLASFFSSNPSQALAEGDTLGIAYTDLFSTASNGGRRQSIPENSNTSIPAASFFNSRVHPELLFNALPVCKVINGRLVFGTGTEVPAGSTQFDLAAPPASSMTYGGGGNWADGTTNPPTTVEAQLDKIITDLAGSGAAKITYGGGGNWADGTTNPSTTVEAQLDKLIADLAGTLGTAKIQGVVVGTDLAVGTLQAQIANLASNWLKMSRANVITAAQTFTSPITANDGITGPGSVVTINDFLALIGVHATGSVRADVNVLFPGSYTFGAADIQGAGTFIAGSAGSTPERAIGASTAPLICPLRLHAGMVMGTWTIQLFKNTNASNTITATVYEQDRATVTPLGSATNSDDGTSIHLRAINGTSLTATVVAGRAYYIEVIGSGTSGDFILTYTMNAL